MAALVDTSVLLRLANAADPGHQLATDAVVKLGLQGEVLYITPQNLVEFRAVATRPVGVNGLGLSPADAAARAAALQVGFGFLPDTPDVYPPWLALVDSLGVVGKQVHDARLVAVCHAHAVPRLLTFNVAHFARLAAFGPGVTVIDPATV